MAIKKYQQDIEAELKRLGHPRKIALESARVLMFLGYSVRAAAKQFIH